MHPKFKIIPPSVVSAVLLIATLAYSNGHAKTLVIGDSLSCESHFGAVGFGTTVARNIMNSGEDVELYCMESSAPSNWVNGTRPPQGGNDTRCYRMASPELRSTLCNSNGRPPRLSTLLEQFNGDRVIVALGTNSLMGGTVDANYSAVASAITSAGKKCEWIGPPQMNVNQGNASVRRMQNNLSGFYRSLQTAVTPACKLIDSRAATAPGTPGSNTFYGGRQDGIHRAPAAGAAWANSVMPVKKRSTTKSNAPGAR